MKFMCQALAALTLGLLAIALAPSGAEAQTTVVSQLSGKCLDVPGGNLTNSSRVAMYNCNGGWNQQFTFRNGRMEIGNTGKCLDASGGGGANNDPIIVYDCHTGANQQWTLQSDGSIRGMNGRCMDIINGNTAEGAQLVLWDCHGGANQKWTASGAPGQSAYAPPPSAQVGLGAAPSSGQPVYAGGGNTFIQTPNGLVNVGPGAGLVGNAGGTMVSSGGLNNANGIVAAGGGNAVSNPNGIVAAGGGNAVANPNGIVAAGGGNAVANPNGIVAAGGGNAVGY